MRVAVRVSVRVSVRVAVRVRVEVGLIRVRVTHAERPGQQG